MNLKKIETSSANDYDKRYWVKLINSLSGFKSLNLLSTVSKEEQTNLSVVSSAFHLGANPPLMGLVLRPHSKSSPRHSFMNIKETGIYTLNHVGEDFYKKAHQTSARYDREVSEFEEVGLTKEYREDFKAPFVKEASLKMSLTLKEIKYVELNHTNIVIGQIETLYLPEDCLYQDGYVDIEKAGSLCVSGLDSYHKTQRKSRLSYAKPKKEVREIPLRGESS